MNNSLRQQYLDVIGIQSWQSTLEDDLIEPEIVQEPQLYKKPQPEKEPQAIFFESQQAVNIESKSVNVNKAIGNEELNSSNITLQDKTSDNFTADEKSLETQEKAKVKIKINNEPDSDTYSDLKQTIDLCKKCPSRNSRLNALTGQGSSNAPVFIIGGAPNAEEDRLGKYLVNQSDTLFQAMLNSIDLEHEYFFTGLIKCYSMEDFRFSEQDKLNCTPYLHSQIEQINPAVLFVLGAAEARALLDTKQSFNELRGHVHLISINKKDYPVVVSYHPAYLLRNPLYKKESLKDLIMVKNLLK